MVPAVEKLIKILQLEKNRDFDNRSIFGGFQRFLPHWKNEALIQGMPINKINKISELLSIYSDLNKKDREISVRKILTELELEEPKPNKITESRQIIAEKAEPYLSPKGSKPEIELSIVEDYSFEKALSNSVTKVPGIGKSRAEALSRLGIESIKDLIYFFPRKHEDFSNLSFIKELNFGEKVSIAAKVKSSHTRKYKNNKQSLTEVILEDGTGTIRITFFNQPFLTNSIRVGMGIMVSGKVEMYMGRYVLNNPEWLELDRQGINLNRLFPYYPLTKGITQKWIRGIIFHQLDLWLPKVSDFFSKKFLNKADILDLPTALRNVHFPDNLVLKKKAEDRFAFQDTFFLHLVMLIQKRDWQISPAKKIFFETKDVETLEQSLSYKLTNAQRKSIVEIAKDLSSGIPMSRLIQGDVGSGKTIVSAFSVAAVVRSGYQAAIMAPTGILAEQLFRNIGSFLIDNQVVSKNEICYLSGDTPEKEKDVIRAGLKTGTIKLAIGTHALLEDRVEFKNLELVVIDEQHRFGVMQRKKIREKGNSCHLLVMTATPIPRTLALTIYGDLDLSIIDEIPPGRKSIKTTIIHPQQKEKAYSFIRNQINSGSQAFIVYPMVESDEEEQGETNAAVNEFKRLKTDVFPDLSIGLIHGRMKPEQKDSTMTDFRNNKYSILVSTTVVEVGVDIPNATVMMIEGANHFGLSQLHQLRGRVGRGQTQSYCLLIPENEDSIENERLKAMVGTNDGFKLAEIDLTQRGPGDFIGTRQSGFKEIRFSTIMDVDLIERARSLAQEVVENEPDLINENSHLYKIIMSEYWKKMIGEDN